MNAQALREAVALLVGARRTGVLLDGLPASCRPQGVDDAHAIQEATVAALGDSIAGWKIASALDGRVVRGALLRSRIIPTGGSITAADVPLLGIEAEVAFRFDRELAPREQIYGYDEVADAVSAFAAIEIVDSRFRDYRGAPLIERIADFVSNGAFVVGEGQPRWRELDLVDVAVRLELDGKPIVERTGGHPAGDPLLPAIELVNDLRRAYGVRAGQVMTTGSYTGLHFAKPGQRAAAVFEGLGSAEVQLVA
jgi:2-keto-4-pentenoate hydratase